MKVQTNRKKMTNIFKDEEKLKTTKLDVNETLLNIRNSISTKFNL